MVAKIFITNEIFVIKHVDDSYRSQGKSKNMFVEHLITHNGVWNGNQFYPYHSIRFIVFEEK